MRERFNPLNTAVKAILEEQLDEEEALDSWDVLYPERVAP